MDGTTDRELRRPRVRRRLIIDARITLSELVGRLRGAGELGADAVVGARILDVSLVEGRAVLCDAFTSLGVAFSPATAPSLGVGDLVVVQIADAAAPKVEKWLAHTKPARAEGDADWVRFSLRGVGEGLRLRAEARRIVREIFDELGFLEVETPLAVPSPGLDPHLSAVAADEAFLITSPEYQMKRLLSGGVYRCWQLARCFRRDEAGALHNPEFTMLEWYRAFADVEAMLDDTERLVVAVATGLGGAPVFALPGRTVSLARPFPRLTVREAFAKYAAVDEAEMLRLAAHDEETFFHLLVTCIEPALAAADTPVFLCEYPTPQASLARRKPGDDRYAERFELYAAGVELCNGFGELTDPAEQRARLLADQATRRDRDLPIYPLDERFLTALEHGLPPSAGNALGFDRLVALASGRLDIRSVQAFPAAVL